MSVAKSSAVKRSYQPRAHRFRETEVTRAARAAEKAGLVISRVDVDPSTGRISVVVGKPGDAAAAVNPWDEVLTNEPDSKVRPPLDR
jgi:hypothetical protein